ncbi:MAG: signal recognition particle-docking protein FtsY [Ignavibacteria bacterium]|nr:signal recognition particle-docking protein FtsY [Ignavibacteria bacterium]MBK8381277.1 signal recognition particle-docking protein FtsY [Ignavibacteria bacterium]MBK9406167.1 signal recognition particle-docking protein FtsY [Ignavibacteria bacterium]MBL0106320.1 signal recognition particle-docking protein FtsY [Ignavibacteria bacterium]
MSFLDKIGFKKLKDGLFKTKENLVDRVNRLVNARGVIDDDFLAELEEILISSDIGFDTSETLINNIRERTQRDKYTDQKELNELINDEIKKVFADTTSEFSTFDFDLKQKPYVIMVVGVNGVGKTTSIGKLAYNFKKAGKSVLIGSADTFRAAANDQLEIWAKRAGVDIIQSKSTSDPASVAFETVKSAVAKNIDVVIIDTAGRLHNKSHLMEELKKIKRVMQKVNPDAPQETFIVIDSTTGQNGLNQAKEFSKALDGLTGIILTKLDGTAKGGIVLKINKEMNLPVRFIGVGEQIDDLQVFDSMSFVEAMFEK